MAARDERDDLDDDADDGPDDLDRFIAEQVAADPAFATHLAAARAEREAARAGTPRRAHRQRRAATTTPVQEG